MAAKLLKSFSAAGADTNTIRLFGNFNLSITGTFVATINVERNFNDGRGWLIVKSYTAVAEESGFEREPDVDYRLNCTAYTSGSASCRLSQ